MAPISQDSEVSNLANVNSPPQPAEAQQQFLRLHLTAETIALLPTKYLTEVLTIPTEQIAPMPNVSPWIVGTHNWRSQILWLVDLSYLLGLEPMYGQIFASTYTAAILQVDSSDRHDESRQFIGLAVKQIGSMERFSRQQIKPASLSTSDHRLAKFLQGYWCKSEAEILTVLDSDSILQAISQPMNK